MHCDLPCAAGYYGDDCQNVCNCHNGAECNHITGKCICAPGELRELKFIAI